MAKTVEQPHGGKVNQWERGESGNPNGRPRKTLKRLEQLIGIEFNVTLSKADKFAILEAMLEMSGNELAKIGSDKDTPIFMVNIAKAILDDTKKGQVKTLSELMDRFFGKAAQPLTGDPEKPLQFVLPPGTGDKKSDPIE